MAEHRFIRNMEGLAPGDVLSQDFLSTLKPGRDLLMTVRKPRNGRQHSLYWVLCSLIADNREGWISEDVSDFFKMSCGHYRRVFDAHGNEHRFPKSISYGSMSQDEFNPFFNRCIDLTSERIIPGLGESELRRELESMVR